MTALSIFGATFVLVLALGLQSLNVNRGHYAAAFLTSLAISSAQLAILKIVPAAEAPVDYLAFMSGGPLGIVCAMYLHPLIVRRLFNRSTNKESSS